MLLSLSFCADAAGADASAVERALTVKVSGVEGEQLATVRNALTIVSYEQQADIGEARLQRLLDQVPAQVLEAMQRFGYYRAQARVSQRQDAEQRPLIEIQVERGEPVRVTSRRLKISGAAARNARIMRSLDAFAPAEGAVFNHRSYEASKAIVERALRRRGYFDQELVTAQVEIKRHSNSAEMALHWRSGTRYFMGELRFEGAQFDEPLMRRFVTWPAGARYDQRRIEALQQSLAASGWFAGIEVIPETERASNLHVPILVRLRPGKRTGLSAGLSYETDVGAGVRTGVERRWMNRHGHALASEVSVAQKVSDISLDYRIPRGRRAADQYLLGARYRDENTAVVNAQSIRYSAGLTIGRDLWSGAMSFNLLDGSFLIGSRDAFDPRRSSQVVYAELNASRFFSRNRIRPDNGLSLRLTTRAAGDAAGSDVALLQARGEARGVVSLREGTRFLGRVEIGATHTNQFRELPPELRFFAGGDQSVRGYAYQSLGERDAFGEPIGGRFLSTFSAELEQRFRPGFSVAVFFDGGDVFSHGRPKLHFGTGVGLRWASPVGPIRVDLGHGLGNPDSSVQLHISAGPDL
ncbi:MAG: autotransporter assembly complex family protein [Lysobacterales bacterium]